MLPLNKQQHNHSASPKGSLKEIMQKEYAGQNDNGMKKVSTPGTYRYKIWLKQANFDLEAAKVSYKNGYYEWACFQSEQSVEKALKSIIVKEGYRPPKIHRISVLMSMGNRVSKLFRNTKFDFKDIESFTFISRYPFLIPGENSSPHEYITSEDANTCINQAHQFLQKIQSLLKG